MAEQITKPTWQYAKVFVDPFYLESMDGDTNHTFTVDLYPPDGVGSIKSAIIEFHVLDNPSIRYYLWVNDQTCTPESYYLSTSYANAEEHTIAFDCTKIIQSEGTYTIKLQPDEGTGTTRGWLEMTYISQEEKSLKIFGTEYYLESADGKVWLQFLDSNTNPINNATCLLDIFYPNVTYFKNSQMMTYLTSSLGLYYYDFQVPDTEGVYMTQVLCKYTTNTSTYNVTKFKLISGTEKDGNYNKTLIYDHDFHEIEGNATTLIYQYEYNVTIDIPEGLTLEDIISMKLTTAHEAEDKAGRLLILNVNTSTYEPLYNLIIQGHPQVSNSYTWTTNYSHYFNNRTITIRIENTTVGNINKKGVMQMDYVSFDVSFPDVFLNEIRGGGEVHVTDFKSFFENISANIDNLTVNLENVSLNLENITIDLGNISFNLFNNITVNISNQSLAEVWQFENRTVEPPEPVYTFVGGTEYVPNETLLITVRVAVGSSPIDGATCNMTVTYPNLSVWINQANMEQPAIMQGVYYNNSFLIPNVKGTYPYIINCAKGSGTYFLLNTFHVVDPIDFQADPFNDSNIIATLGVLNSSVQNSISSVNDTTLSVNETLLSVNQTLGDLILQLPSLVWSFATRTLTEFTFSVNLTQETLDSIWAYDFRNVTFTPNVFFNGTVTFNGTVVDNSTIINNITVVDNITNITIVNNITETNFTEVLDAIDNINITPVVSVTNNITNITIENITVEKNITVVDNSTINFQPNITTYFNGTVDITNNLTIIDNITNITIENIIQNITLVDNITFEPNITTLFNGTIINNMTIDVTDNITNITILQIDNTSIINITNNITEVNFSEVLDAIDNINITPIVSVTDNITNITVLQIDNTSIINITNNITETNFSEVLDAIDNINVTPVVSVTNNITNITIENITENVSIINNVTVQVTENITNITIQNITQNVTIIDNITFEPNITTYFNGTVNVTVNVTENITQFNASEILTAISDSNISIYNRFNNLPTDIWAYDFRNLTYYEVTQIDYQLIADYVWNATIRTLTSFGFTVEINDTDILNAIDDINITPVVTVDVTENITNITIVDNVTEVNFTEVLDAINNINITPVVSVTNNITNITIYDNISIINITNNITEVNFSTVLQAISQIPELTWLFENRNLTYYETTDINESEIARITWEWNYRTLTDFNFTVDTTINLSEVDNITAIIDPATIWQYENRSLSSFCDDVGNDSSVGRCVYEFFFRGGALSNTLEESLL
ncbi:hypothetical protein KKC87_04435 [Patescibacteria group bacterium]|nr:hypothetical protein [Patescibacteria group bacterium]